MIDLTGYRLVIENNVVTECVPPKTQAAYETLGQRDPKWARILLGNSLSSTLGSYGCLVTSMAVLAGCTPQQMNDALRRNGGFQAEPRGAYMAYAGFTAAFEKASESCGTRQKVKFVHMSGKMLAGQERPAGWVQKLTDWLEGGNPAIVEVDMDIKSTSQQQHFAAALPEKVLGNIQIVDPWDKVGDTYGKKQMLLPEYGKDIASAVWRYILYEVT